MSDTSDSSASSTPRKNRHQIDIRELSPILSNEELKKLAKHRSVPNITRDRFGIVLAGPTDQELATAEEARLEALRMKKWQKMVIDLPHTREKNADKFKERVRKGIPDAFRATVWMEMSGATALKQANPSLYDTLLERHLTEEPSDHTRRGGTIDRDITRTMPKQELFEGKDSFGQEVLRRLLVATSINLPEVGYCQGMNFIAALFISYMPEKDAFFLLQTILTQKPYNMKSLFGATIEEIHVMLYQFNQLIQIFIPTLKRHFDKEEILPATFATHWFMTVFTSSFPMHFVVRIWDAFLNEGWKIVFRISLALLKIHKDELLKRDCEELIMYFSEIPSNTDFKEVFKVAYSLSLKRKQLDELKAEYKKNGPMIYICIGLLKTQR